MTQLKSPIVWRLILWLLLLSLMPIGVVLVFVQRQVQDSYIHFKLEEAKDNARLITRAILAQPGKEQENISSYATGSVRSAFILDVNGNYLFHSNPALIGKPASADLGEEVVDQLLSSESLSLDDSANGRLIASNTSGDTKVVVVFDRKAVVEVPLNQLSQSIILQLTLVLVIASLAGGVGILTVLNPLEKLANFADQTGVGDLYTEYNTDDLEGEISVLANNLNKLIRNVRNSIVTLEERVSERTDELQTANEGNARRAAQFEAIAQIARTISSTQTMDMLLPQITETISTKFNFYHVGIFLLDTHREFAILVAANSEGGKRMLARNHRLQVGETGIVGYVTNIGQPRVALDVGKDATYFNNPDLPDTHSEIALPLRVGSDIFGALDVQSTEPNAFSQEDINILSTLADQVSIAIQNARSYQQSSEALAQAENASYQLSGQQWKRFLTDKTVDGYYFDGVDTKIITSAEKQRRHNLTIPLTLRGSQIGSIKLSALDPNREWTDDEISMIQAAAERTALALENARLFLESQKRASKERTIGEISAKIGGSTSLETILQTAIQELGHTLPNTDIAIQFKRDQETE